MPSFNRIAARITEPTVGASVWASGSHVWNGNIGTFTPKPTNMPAKIQIWVAPRIPAPATSVRARMSKVRSDSPVAGSVDRKNRARNDSSISAEPNSVNRKNLIDA